MEKRDHHGMPYEGPATQLELFDDQESKWPFRTALAIILVVVTALFATAVWAEEPIAVFLNRAVLCDDIDQLKNQIDVLSSSDVNNAPLQNIEGCGYLAQPTFAVITPIEEYENKYVVSYLAEVRIPNQPVQYGYIAWQTKAEETGI